ncbi:hypothetical protein FQZ97_889180 [compost metagenome]
MGVDEFHGTGEVRNPNDAQYRTEDLFLVDGHFRADLVKQGGAHEIAILGAGNLKTAAVHHQLGTLDHTRIDVALDLRLMRGSDQRPHVCFRVNTIANPQLVNARQQFLDQLVANVTHRHGNGDGHAALARGTVSRTDQCISGLIQIGVRHDDHVVLGTAQGLNALAALSRFTMNVLSNRGRAYERNGLDIRML